MNSEVKVSIWEGSSEVHSKAVRYCTASPPTRGLTRTLVKIPENAKVFALVELVSFTKGSILSYRVALRLM